MSPTTIDLVRRLLVQRAAAASEDARRMRELCARPGARFGVHVIREFEAREREARAALVDFDGEELCRRRE